MKTLFHFARFLIGIDQPHSRVTEQELVLLQRYASGAETIVEIGCYEGKTSVALARSSSKLKQLYSIDPFLRGRLGLCYSELIAQIHCRRQDAKNVKLMKGFSHDIAPRFDLHVDFLFIDADHRYESIKRDWHDWFHKVRDGGIIALHDCKKASNSPDYLGSMQFYDNDMPQMTGIAEVDGIDSLVLFRVNRQTNVHTLAR